LELALFFAFSEYLKYLSKTKMRGMRVFVLLYLILTLSTEVSNAQNDFVEGMLTYSVKITKNDAEQTKQNIKGFLYIKLKGYSLIKELQLESGFSNTMLYNSAKKLNYSFRKISTQGYAIQLNSNQLEQKLNNCKDLNIEELPSDTKTIKNFKTEKAKLYCNNNKPVIVYYTKEWNISNPYIFEDFPPFNYLPLAFEINKEDGSTFDFELKSIEAKPMDNSTFEIPQGYKVITQEEFRSWQH
jgi:hypothetical protein